MSMALTAPPGRKRFLIVACLFIGIFIAYLDRVNVSVLAANEPFLAYMGIEGMPLQIGMMMTVFLAAYGIANVVLSPLGDYLGPRKAMMLCILIWTIALIIGGVATSFALIIICRILLGIGEGFYYPLQSVFIKNWFPKQERGRANAAWIVGQSVAPAIAMPFFTWWIGTHGWRSNFFLCAALGLIPLWLLWRYVADKPEQLKGISEQELAYIKAGQETESASSSESFMLRVKPVITNYCYWLLVLWYLCLQCLYWGMITWLPTYLKSARGFSWAEMGWLASLPFVLSIFSKAAAGVFVDKIGRSAPILMVLMFFRRYQYLFRHNNRTQIYVSGTTLLRRRFLHDGYACCVDIITRDGVREIYFRRQRRNERRRERPVIIITSIYRFIYLYYRNLYRRLIMSGFHQRYRRGICIRFND
ncbi:membrane protein [Salmonella enterica subsp. enterica]|uniref:Membrane protein n=1 Tax=Salmonella enterica I TaxID=59201 RepID=A0A447P3B1_SALET|nr:membrane protein [Salmonella enterica subsp. enterica]